MRFAEEFVSRRAVVIVRLSLALVWIWTGVICLAVAPIAESEQLVARIGIQGAAARWIVWLTSAFEIVLGVAVASGRWPVVIAWTQIVLIVGFTAIITAFMPEWWLHPFGPISKNMVLVAAAWAASGGAGESSTQKPEIAERP